MSLSDITLQVPPHPPQFLDTSHQIDRVAGRFRDRQKRSNEIRRSAEVYTSTIVMMEYKRSTLADLALVRETIDIIDSESGRREPHITLGELRDSVRDRQREYGVSFSRRRLERTIGWVFEIERLLQGQSTPFKVRALRAHCQSVWERAKEEFFIIVYGENDERDLRDKEDEAYRNGTRCALAPDSVDPLDILRDRTPQCQRDRADCALSEFLHNHSLRMTSLTSDVRERKKKPPEIKKGLWNGLRRLIRTIPTVPSNPVGKGLCWNINDLQVTLETPDGGCLMATDKDFEYLFKFLTHAHRCPWTSLMFKREKPTPRRK